MDKISVFPDKKLTGAGIVSNKFLDLGVKTFIDACIYFHKLPYGYNSTKDDMMIVFHEKMGTCTTKHSVIATLAAELHLQVTKTICIYAMTEEIVTGTNVILDKYNLPYVPMVHCFLEYNGFKVDLTEGNNNGKNRSIETFLFTERVDPHISQKEEYLLYRKAVETHILPLNEMKGIDMKTILHAREEGIALLKSKV